MKVTSVQNYKLALVSKVFMDESRKNPETGEFEKTNSGKKDMYYKYTFLSDDEFQEEFSFQKSPSNGDYSSLKDKAGKLVFEIGKFGKVWSVKPVDFIVNAK